MPVKVNEVQYRRNIVKNRPMIGAKVPVVPMSFSQEGWTGSLDFIIYGERLENVVEKDLVKDRYAFIDCQDFRYYMRAHCTGLSMHMTMTEAEDFCRAQSVGACLQHQVIQALKEGKSLADVYEEVGGYAKEHEKSLASFYAPGQVFLAKHVGQGMHLVFGELWESSEEMLAYYAKHKPGLNFDLRESDYETVEGLAETATYIVKKGTRIV